MAGGLYAYNQDPDDTWHRRIPYQGHLEENGAPVSGAVDLEVELFTTPTGGSAVWSESFTSLEVDAGKFSIILGDDVNNAIPAEYFSARDPLYLQVVVNAQVIGSRQRIFGAPFASSSGIPPGMIMPFAGSTADVPAGWLFCDGSNVERATYPALYAAIGNAHGSADGSHFNLPDFRGRFLRGTSNSTTRDPNRNTRTAAATGGNTGNAVGSIQDDATSRPSSAFTSNTTGHHNHNNGNYNRLMILGSNSRCDRSFSSGDTSCSEPDLGTSATLSSGGNHAHTITGGGDSETRPTNANVNFVVKY
ncbi:MAG: tail fiber protein [Deltaproteobacteria bacterium]|nr:tail fiber protein [Deltaproteobacteria bacterium]